MSQGGGYVLVFPQQQKNLKIDLPLTLLGKKIHRKTPTFWRLIKSTACKKNYLKYWRLPMKQNVFFLNSVQLQDFFPENEHGFQLILLQHIFPNFFNEIYIFPPNDTHLLKFTPVKIIHANYSNLAAS